MNRLTWTETTCDDCSEYNSSCGVFMIRENYDSDDFDLFRWDRFQSSGTLEEMQDLAEEIHMMD